MKILKYIEDLKLEIIVFVSGAVVMVLEIVGSRILAPYLGTSIFVWTSLIGVVLGSLALGYYFGGRLADKRASYMVLGRVLLYAQLALIFTVLFESSVLPLLQKTNYDLRSTAVLAGILFFGPASVLLGVISPYCVKLKLDDLKSSGETVGSLYALSTLGSILGTFLTGFVLFSYFRTSQILFFLIFILGVLSIVSYSKERSLMVKILVILVALGLFLANEIYYRDNIQKGFIDTDTSYNRIWIVDKKEEDNRLRRYMFIDKSSSTAIYLDTKESPFEYVNLFDAVNYYKPDAGKVLVLGGAGYSYPRHYLEMHSQTNMDVVEIDPGQTELAKRYFYLVEDPRLNVIHEDGRTYINKYSKEQGRKYDIIFADAFNSLYAIPFHLLSKEFVSELYNSTNDDGIVVLNLISAVSGDQSKLFDSVYKTYRSVFPYVDIYSTFNSTPNLPQNIVFVAYKKNVVMPEEFKSSKAAANLVDKRYLAEAKSGGIVLTDDYAPVESMVFEIIRDIN